LGLVLSECLKMSSFSVRFLFFRDLNRYAAFK
jgi:hypothetical protein